MFKEHANLPENLLNTPAMDLNLDLTTNKLQMGSNWGYQSAMALLADLCLPKVWLFSFSWDGFVVSLTP